MEISSELTEFHVSYTPSSHVEFLNNEYTFLLGTCNASDFHKLHSWSMVQSTQSGRRPVYPVRCTVHSVYAINAVEPALHYQPGQCTISIESRSSHSYLALCTCHLSPVTLVLWSARGPLGGRVDRGMIATGRHSTGAPSPIGNGCIHATSQCIFIPPNALAHDTQSHSYLDLIPFLHHL